MLYIGTLMVLLYSTTYSGPVSSYSKGNDIEFINITMCRG